MNLKEIDKLYRTELQKNIKTAFELFEEEGWTLRDIINHVIEYHTKDEYDDYLTHYLDKRELMIGPVDLKFYTWEDDEPLDVDTHYVLQLKIQLISESDDILNSFERKVNTEFLNKPFMWYEKDKEFKEQHQKAERAIWNVFDEADLAKKNQLYSYLFEYGKEKINNISSKK